MERNNSEKLGLGMKPSENTGHSNDREKALKLWESIILFFALTMSAAIAGPVDTITDFRPSPVNSTYGTVRQVQFFTNVIDLKANTLVQSPEGAVKYFRFAEPVW